MPSRDHEYTLKIAEEALDRIKALGAPADPAGFELWYTYVTGSNETLNQRINGIIEERSTLSRQELEHIQEEFLTQSQISSAVGQASTKISAEVDHIVGMLSELILTTARGREDCSKASSRLSDPADREVVQAISDTLIESLRAIELQHTALERQLVASKAEVEAANHALAKATAQANLDSVTGLANRRGFDSALDRAVKRSHGDGAALSLLLIDIDHFKQFNDRFGHLMGDTVLRLISVILRQSVGDKDFPARYGGEEFAIILPDQDLSAAVALAESIRTKIMSRQLKKRTTGETLGGMTVSIGVASLNRADGPRSMVERADGLLYEAKHSGRNCTRWQLAANELAEAI